MWRLTWKLRTTPSRRPICALLARERRISGNASGSWPTPVSPREHDSDQTAGKWYASKNQAYLDCVAQLASWPTPTKVDAIRGVETNQARLDRGAKTGTTLNDAAAWATPNARDFKVGSSTTYLERTGQKKGDSLSNQAASLGPKSIGSPVGTGKTGQLNPSFSRWLMGFPAAWDACAPTATRSSRKLLPNSSAP
jgi:hypothetical protein